MYTFNFHNREIVVSDSILRYLEELKWIEKDEDAILQKIEDMIKSKAEASDFMGMQTEWGFRDLAEKMVSKLVSYGVYDLTWENFVAGSKGMNILAEMAVSELMFKMNAINTRDAQSNAAYNRIVSEELSNVRGLDFGIITSSIISYAIYDTMNEKATRKSEAQANANIDERTGHLNKIYQNEMLNSIEQYYVNTVIPKVLDAFKETSSYMTSKYLDILCKIGQIDMETIKRLDFPRSQSVLSNLKFTDDCEKKVEIILVALNLCPFNSEIYKIICKENILETGVVPLMDLMGVTDSVVAELKMQISPDKLDTYGDETAIALRQLAILTKKNEKEIFASAFMDEYNKAKETFRYFAKMINEHNGEGFVKKLDSSNLDSEISSKIKAIISKERAVWLEEKCGFELLNEIADMIPYTGTICYDDVIGAYISGITDYSRDVLSRIMEERQKEMEAETERLRLVQEKRTTIEHEIVELEKTVEENKYKVFGKGARIRKGALEKIETLKQELSRLK